MNREEIEQLENLLTTECRTVVESQMQEYLKKLKQKYNVVIFDKLKFDEIIKTISSKDNPTIK